MNGYRPRKNLVWKYLLPALLAFVPLLALGNGLTTRTEAALSTQSSVLSPQS